MTKARPTTLRQRLRDVSETRLNEIENCVNVALERVSEEMDTDISMTDVMRMMSHEHTKTIRERLVTELTNEAEAVLEKLYNRQSSLDLEKSK